MARDSEHPVLLSDRQVPVPSAPLGEPRQEPLDLEAVRGQRLHARPALRRRWRQRRRPTSAGRGRTPILVISGPGGHNGPGPCLRCGRGGCGLRGHERQQLGGGRRCPGSRHLANAIGHIGSGEAGGEQLLERALGLADADTAPGLARAPVSGPEPVNQGRSVAAFGRAGAPPPSHVCARWPLLLALGGGRAPANPGPPPGATSGGQPASCKDRPLPGGQAGRWPRGLLDRRA